MTLLGDATATFMDGVLEQADQTDGEITSCYNGDTRTGAALLVPQDMTNKPFIKVSINGNTFTYTPATAAAVTPKGRALGISRAICCKYSKVL